MNNVRGFENGPDWDLKNIYMKAILY